MSDATSAAERGSENWNDAVRHQTRAVPDHTDFHLLAGETVSTLRSLGDLAEILHVQVRNYGQARKLYDDTGVVEPDERVTVAVDALGMLMHALTMADRYGNEFWSAIGHIGVVEN